MTTATITKPKTKTLYMQLKERCLPLIEAYHDDLLKHDRRFLRENKGMPFLHYTRECGTHLLQLYRTEDLPPKGMRVPYLFGTADRDWIAKGIVDCARYIASKESSITLLAFYCDGQRLKEITVEKGLEIARDWHWGLVKEWREKERQAQGYSKCPACGYYAFNGIECFDCGYRAPQP